jgi:hypothetical protein
MKKILGVDNQSLAKYMSDEFDVRSTPNIPIPIFNRLKILNQCRFVQAKKYDAIKQEKGHNLLTKIGS